MKNSIRLSRESKYPFVEKTDEELDENNEELGENCEYYFFGMQ